MASVEVFAGTREEALRLVQSEVTERTIELDPNCEYELRHMSIKNTGAAANTVFEYVLFALGSDATTSLFGVSGIVVDFNPQVNKGLLLPGSSKPICRGNRQRRWLHYIAGVAGVLFEVNKSDTDFGQH